MCTGWITILRSAVLRWIFCHISKHVSGRALLWRLWSYNMLLCLFQATTYSICRVSEMQFCNISITVFQCNVFFLCFTAGPRQALWGRDVFFKAEAFPVVVKPSRPCLSYHIGSPLPPRDRLFKVPLWLMLLQVCSSRNICFFSEGGETNRPIVTPVSVLISSPLAFRTGWNYRGRVKGK